MLVSQFSVADALYTDRPDLVGFLNGLPLVVIELKQPGVPARQTVPDVRDELKLTPTTARSYWPALANSQSNCLSE